MEEERTQSKKRKRNKPRKSQNNNNPSHQKSKVTHEPNQSSSGLAHPTKSSTFLDKMRARLSGGHFRMINEKLYTCSGKEALDYFKDDPALFDMYHTGYQEQMSHWPEQPVNIIMKWLKNHNPSLVVADFGCGDGRLAKNVKNKVFSFDLVSNDPSVIACDMSKTPLDSSVIDVAVFCLSLMGTNYQNYLKEAHRVLKPWFAPHFVKHFHIRFDPNTGGADPKKFSKAVCDLGYSSVLKDYSNKMFVLLYFKKKDKQKSEMKEIEWPELKPCLYKRR
ncbi:ribosomal RNA-processing protein 8 isoform X1 [Quercus robur]|uniref:ribosomal RNA-processing protein 8 isoform X1 n=1 Tax=Quercus robur TaxID=38942 RepID=UPI0021618943|nr:ribosomal RNA-processing protein 8 isoform X1 [Quercus robur]